MKIKISKVLHGKIFLVILILLLILSVGVVGTYAWFTWSSPKNAALTMTIGELADVTFTTGNDINASLTPVYDYEDGEKTTFTINHKGNTSNVIVHTVTLNVSEIPEELRNKSLKYKLIGDNNIIREGDFSRIKNSSRVTLIDNIGLEEGSTTYSLYIYIDGNVENNPNMMNKSLKSNIVVTANESMPTPLSDFTYAIDTWDVSEDGSKLINLPSNNILLTGYIGNNDVINIASSYFIDGVEYKVVIYSDTLNKKSTFIDNNNITEVNFAPGVIFTEYNGENLIQNSVSSLFENCKSLIRVTGLSNNIENMEKIFKNCISLKTITNIPSSLIKLNSAFEGCTNLKGNIKITSSNIEEINKDIEYPFYNTENEIILEVPNGTSTYDALSENKPANVSIITY